jgi:outer membrane biosynthesis protein TonB
MSPIQITYLPNPDGFAVPGVSGNVVIRVCVHPDGVVDDPAKIKESSDPRLNDAAIRYAESIKANPGTMSGENIAEMKVYSCKDLNIAFH